MGGHDCPATRYLIMSDETAFAWTMIFLFSGIAAAWLARYRKRWFYTGSLGRNGNGNNAGRMSRVPTGDLLGYGSFSAKTLTLDRIGELPSSHKATPNQFDVKDSGAKQKMFSNGKPPLPDGAEKKPVRKPRIHFFDNCRWWLETAVILKHTLEFFPPGGLTRNTSWWMEGISNYFETFFMAMFVFCSGFLSKGEMNSRRAKRYLFRVWIPFVLINFINRGVDKGWGHWLDNFPSFTNAYDTSWFLACVIQWRMLVTFFATMTPSGRMGVALILSWFSGYFFTSTPTFHLAETLSFLPFYLAGHMVTAKHVEMVKRPIVRHVAMVLSAVFFVGMMVFSFMTFSSEETIEYGIKTFDGQRNAMTIFSYSGYIKGWQRCHYFTTNVPSEVSNYWIVWCHRVIYQLITWVMGLAFILMIPHNKQFYTESGGYTIYPYLLQIFFFALERNFIRALTGHGIVPASNIFGWVCIVLSIPAVNLMLSSYWCRKCWWIIFEPSWLDWFLFKKPNKTLSPFVGKELKNQTDVTNQFSVREIVQLVAEKENLNANKLVVSYNGQVIGDVNSLQTLEEATGYELTEMKSFHLESRYISSLFCRNKRRIKINAFLGYGWLDFIFSVLAVTATCFLIAVTKLSVTPGRVTPAAPVPTHTHHSVHTAPTSNGSHPIF
ncbi:hypothetical protein AAMO2058_000494800 [Amorphochlora amoebiformis]